MNYSWIFAPFGKIDDLGRAVELKIDRRKWLTVPLDIPAEALGRALETFVRTDSCVVSASGGAPLATLAGRSWPGFKVEVGSEDAWLKVGKSVYSGLMIQLDGATVKGARLVDGPWSESDIARVDKSVLDGREFHEAEQLRKNMALARASVAFAKHVESGSVRKAQDAELARTLQKVLDGPQLRKTAVTTDRQVADLQDSAPHRALPPIDRTRTESGPEFRTRIGDHALPGQPLFDYDAARFAVLEQIDPRGANQEMFARARAALRSEILRRDGW